MKICITRSNAQAYSETFIAQQITSLQSIFGEEHVYTIYEGWLPQRDPSGRLLNPLPLFLLSKCLKRFFHIEDSIINLYGLIQFLSKHQFDVVLANYGVTGAKIWKACARAHVPLIVHFHGFDAFHKSTLSKYSRAYQDMFQYASYIIAVSEDMRRQLIALGADQQKIIRIPYGINTTIFVPGDPSMAPPVFLAVGRFTAKKAPQLTIQAFSSVVQQVPESRLIMVGDGELLETCVELAKHLHLSDKITFKGVLPSGEVALMMRQVRAFVQHSMTAPDGDKEGMPVAILEAASSGLPVVSTYHAGIPEAVLHGQTGFLVEEGDVDGMAAYMVKLATDPLLARNLGLAARKHVINQYAIDRQIRALSEIFIQTVNFDRNKQD